LHFILRISLAAYDVQLEFIADGSSGGAAPEVTFLDFDSALAASTSVGLPFIPAAYRGPLFAALVWAHEHSKDNALAHYNPGALPIIEGNAGEGFVVRPVVERVTR